MSETALNELWESASAQASTTLAANAASSIHSTSGSSARTLARCASSTVMVHPAGADRLGLSVALPFGSRCRAA